MEGETKKPKILLIEDDIFMLELLVQELEGAGFEVGVAKTGQEGLEKFEKTAPDLVLLDISLPDERGFETFRKIRRKPGGPETKVIVLSNLSEANDIEEGRRLGAVDYLTKANFSLPEIIEKIRTHLEK